MFIWLVCVFVARVLLLLMKLKFSCRIKPSFKSEVIGYDLEWAAGWAETMTFSLTSSNRSLSQLLAAPTVPQRIHRQTYKPFTWVCLWDHFPNTVFVLYRFISHSHISQQWSPLCPHLWSFPFFLFWWRHKLGFPYNSLDVLMALKLTSFKGIVHPKMKTNSHIIPNLYYLAVCSGGSFS